MQPPGDVISRSFEAWNLRDLDAFLGCMTEDVCYDVPAAVPFSGTLHGHDALAAFAEQLWGFFDRLETTVDKIVTDRGRAIIRGHHAGQMPDGTTHTVPFVNVVTLRGERICDVRQQLDAGLVMRAVASRLAVLPAAR